MLKLQNRNTISNYSETLPSNFHEISILCFQGGISSGNGQAEIEKISTSLNLPSPPKTKNYDNILKI